MSKSSNNENTESQYWRQKEREYRELKKSYEKYRDKLSSLKEVLSPLSIHLVNSKKYFEDGGYIEDNGETLDRGKLLEMKNSLEKIIERLSSVISDTNSKISSLQVLMNDCNKKANQAVINASSNCYFAVKPR